MPKPPTYKEGTFREILWQYSRDRYKRDPRYRQAVKDKLEAAKKDKESQK